uniref:Uncharacterized protein n=1 Tax=Electrophorus electricus TaxID=8005 RepID=A0A4W4EFV8_ELEEL
MKVRRREASSPCLFTSCSGRAWLSSAGARRVGNKRNPVQNEQLKGDKGNLSPHEEMVCTVGQMSVASPSVSIIALTFNNDELTALAMGSIFGIY